MAKRKNTYRGVEKLPKGILSISEYAALKDISEPHVYKLWKQHSTEGKEIDFEIVLFKDHTFVIPKRPVMV